MSSFFTFMVYLNCNKSAILFFYSRHPFQPVLHKNLESHPSGWWMCVLDNDKQRWGGGSDDVVAAGAVINGGNICGDKSEKANTCLTH
jgi:hypothetical protein